MQTRMGRVLLTLWNLGRRTVKAILHGMTEEAVARHVRDLAQSVEKRGAPRRLLAVTMIVQGWMLLTGASEPEARQVITKLAKAQLRSFEKRRLS
jgi:hypothetical protein